MRMATQTVLTCVLACLLLEWGCRDKQPDNDASDRDNYLKVQLAGTWQRECDYDPILYEQTLNMDGSVNLKEFRKMPRGLRPPER